MSKKNVEAVVSAMGALLSIIVELVRLIKEFGGEVGADIHRLSQEEGREALQAIARLIAEAGQRARTSFRLTVDYGLTLHQMIAAGDYDWVHEDITEEHFPVSGQGSQDVMVELWHPGKHFRNGDQVIAELDRAKPGYRFANLPELLALGAVQPGFSWQFPITALGSIWHSVPNGCDAVCISVDDIKSSLGLGSLKHDFCDDWRFPVVRESDFSPAAKRHD